VAGAIFYGHLKNDQRNWPLLPIGGIQKTTANDFVYEDTGNSFRLLMRSIYAYANNSNAYPFSGGLLEQPKVFLDGLLYFGMGKSLYANQAKATNEIMKSLGARK
jgi:hypothetical protein